MRKTIINVCECLVVVIICTIVITIASNICERKTSVKKYKDFYSEEENFDILFFGSSHVMNGILPLELWEKHQMTAYNFGTQGATIPTSYWVMRNALDYTKPDLIVLDCALLDRDIKSSTKFSYLHNVMDSFPLSMTKYEAAKDILNDPFIANESDESDEERTLIGLLWNFSVYHSRWDELEYEDFKLSPNIHKGAELRVKIAVPDEYPNVGEERMDHSSVGIEYLEKVISYCQENDICLLLTYIPFPASEGYQREANTVADIAEEYGIGYIDFLKMDIVDYSTDFYDSNSHLNISGARKVTDYLADYIYENYNIDTKHTQDTIEKWEDAYERYRLYLENKNIE